MASDNVFGQAAQRWMYIGNKVYYFYASTSSTPYALKTSGSIGGISYQYHKDGYIIYNGFINCEYANIAPDNTAANIQKQNATTRYYVNGEMKTGWLTINDYDYYFYKIGSANGSGYMCTESRTIGGVYYEFAPNGICFPHVHSYDLFSVINNGNCTQDRIEKNACICGDYITNTTKAPGHVEIVDEAVEPTCTETGLTEGKHCSVCSEVLVKQNVINKLDHDYVDEICQYCGANAHILEAKEVLATAKQNCLEIDAELADLDAAILQHSSMCDSGVCTLEELIIRRDTVFGDYCSFKEEINSLEAKIYELENAEIIDSQVLDQIIYIIDSYHHYGAQFMADIAELNSHVDELNLHIEFLMWGGTDKMLNTARLYADGFECWPMSGNATWCPNAFWQFLLIIDGIELDASTDVGTDNYQYSWNMWVKNSKETNWSNPYSCKIETLYKFENTIQTIIYRIQTDPDIDNGPTKTFIVGETYTLVIQITRGEEDLGFAAVELEWSEYHAALYSVYTHYWTTQGRDRSEGYSYGSTSLTDEDIAYAESVGFIYTEWGSFEWVG